MLLPPSEDGLSGHRPYPGQLLKLRLTGMVQIERSRRGTAAPRTWLSPISHLTRRITGRADHQLLAINKRPGEVELIWIGSTGQPTCTIYGVLDPRVLRQPDQAWPPDSAKHMNHQPAGALAG